jgi:acetyltransferase-like isoleucine patch superfamily enzyme
MIGTGAVVTKDVQPYHIAIGIPARTVKVKLPEGSEATMASGK